jgi:hypothetical protein
MKKVRTVEEMKKERTRLKMLRLSLENEIEKDIEDIKETLAPLSMAKRGLGYVVHKPEDGDLMTATVGVLTELALKKTLFRNSGFLKRWLLSRGTANLLSNLFYKNKDSIYGKLFLLASKLPRSKPGNLNREPASKFNATGGINVT